MRLTLTVLLLSLPAAASVPQDLQAALVRAATDAIGDADATVEVTSWKASRPEVVKAAKSLESLEILPGEQPTGHVTARARLVGRDGTVTPVFVLAEVTAKVSVWVVTCAIASGAALDALCVAAQPRSLDEAREALRASDSLDGRLAARALRPGTVLRATSTTTPILVKSGEQVSVRVVVGAVRVTSRGSAMASGRQGDAIRIRLAGTGSIVEAHVSGPGSVEVTQ